MVKKKTRLALMLSDRQKALKLTDRAVGEKYGWMQQTFNSWKRGTIPRDDVRDALAAFLDVPRAEVDQLAEEAKARAATTSDVAAFDSAQEKGKVSDRQKGKFKFEPAMSGYGPNYVPYGRYAVRVDTNVMEPALLYGCRVWVDSRHFPKPGNEVFVHAGRGVAWIGRLVSIAGDTARLQQYGQVEPFDVPFEAIHTIVLAERIPVAAG